MPSAQSPVELLRALCEGLWLGHSSEGWYKGCLGQSIPWAHPQLCRATEWLGRMQQAHTSLSTSLLDESPRNRHSAEMLPS